jgi:hypothetical protein
MQRDGGRALRCCVQVSLGEEQLSPLLDWQSGVTMGSAAEERRGKMFRFVAGKADCPDAGKKVNKSLARGVPRPQPSLAVAERSGRGCMHPLGESRFPDDALLLLRRGEVSPFVDGAPEPSFCASYSMNGRDSTLLHSI